VKPFSVLLSRAAQARRNAADKVRDIVVALAQRDDPDLDDGQA